MKQKVMHVVKGGNMCGGFYSALFGFFQRQYRGWGDRLTGCFQLTPDFSFFRLGLKMGIYMCTGWYLKVTAAPHLRESRAFHCE